MPIYNINTVQRIVGELIKGSEAQDANSATLGAGECVFLSARPSLQSKLLHELTDGDALLQVQIAIRLLLEEAQDHFHGFAGFLGTRGGHVRG